MTIAQAIENLNWDKQPHGLYEPIAYTLQSGGKRLRPQLVLKGCELFGGREQDAMHAALAIEIFHNFTLLHDDVMDKAPVRRGRPTVHVQWNDNTAILSGDQMLIEAYKELSQLPDTLLPQALRIFNQIGTEICEGQQRDMDFESREDVTLDEYVEMIRQKTSVLLGAALQLGALIGGANAQQQEALYRFGVCIGLAFQIQDDILDVYGDPKTFGKAIGGDILCNKKTFLLLAAKQVHGAPCTMHDAPCFQNDEEKIKVVTAWYDQLGVRAIAEKAMEEYTTKGLQQLALLPDGKAKKELEELAHSLIHRTQ